ncbi:MAG: hypothetical protein JRJ09_06825 [Deltaproteobacteria bacterium]|nr:hypothetical protein [Deltaproteobacteria bacterium]MBW2048229.1 hypothetical protein [Deltaproteobacteria bacterium]MBW2111152.1 hypothetical protein [Deltaproteobacteria bacterium]MBW2353373.1 hypothetical protein [Deltaproteobacteria bacterium]
MKRDRDRKDGGPDTEKGQEDPGCGPDLLGGTTCPGKIEIPTGEEREALMAMKAIKERVRLVKERLAALRASDLERDSSEGLKMEGELSSLKEEWDRWEKKRVAAAKRRMIILGHEPSGTENE